MTKVKCPKCDLPNPSGQAVCSRCQTILPRVNVQSDEPRSGGEREILFRKGQIIANRYTVIDMIGRGGMGCIYRVHDNTLNEDVALKTLLPQYVRDKIVVERFYNEARIARQLSHVNIVRVHDIGFAGNILYISMEYLRGKSLRGMLDTLPPGERVPLRTTLSIMEQLCAALEYAHQYTVHRDIKPENVMIIRDGTIKLMDFGISKLMTNTQLTAASMVMGTPYYMSPEQLKDSSSVDARADIYSVGVMLYEMLTGNLPTGIIKPASQILREVPPALDPIVAQCVEPEPRSRFGSARQLRDALQPVMELIESGTDPRAAKLPRRSEMKSPVGRWLGGAALLVAVAAIAAGGIAGLERARQGALAQARTTITSNSEPPNSEPDFDALAALQPRARQRATAAASSDPTLLALVNLGDKFWGDAERSQKDGGQGATDLGWRAMQCYLGVIDRPAGMTFVPPGTARVALDPVRPDQVITAQIDGFYIDTREVTNGDYDAFVRQSNWRPPAGRPSSDPSLPASMVSFYDAEAYAAANGKSIPTEAQWVRATYTVDGTASLYPWGDDPSQGQANTGDPRDGIPGPAAPGTLETDKTPLGCLDMAGNLSEWTRTFFATSSTDAEVELEANPDQPLPFGREIVVRGGSFRWGPRPNSFLYPLQDRMPVMYEQRFDNVGFRCVRDIPRKLAEIQNRV